MVIEQYTVTTRTYNFPLPTIDTTFPQRFLEQSLHSLKQVQRDPQQINQLNSQQLNTNQQYTSTLQLKPEPITLKPDHQETTIAAVDTSTIKIGETATGINVAIRGATTWRQNGNYKYNRIGPFIFHITEENKNEVYNTLEKSCFTSNYLSNHQAAPNLMQMPTRLASLLERWLQSMLSKTVRGGILLFDGSLTAGTFDTPVERLKEILSYARKNSTLIMAFSKATTLRANGLLITDQLPSKEPPYLLETTGLASKLPVVLLGDIYVARLNKTNIAFRLDIDRETPKNKHLDALEKLLGNDLHRQCYPETLRLSHILCTFTANEVLAMQHFITRNHGIQIVNRPDMHKLLFGAFGKGEVS
jgi:hypothetical protein